MNKSFGIGLVSFGALWVLPVLAGAVVVPSTALEDDAKQAASKQLHQSIEKLDQDERRLSDLVGRLEEDEKEIIRLTEAPSAASAAGLKEDEDRLRDVLLDLKNDVEVWKRSFEPQGTDK